MRNFYILWAALALLTACDNDTPKPAREVNRKAAQPSLRISTQSPATVTWGDTIALVVEPTHPDLSITALTIRDAESRRVYATADGPSVVLRTALTGGGNLRLKVDATLSDGSTASRYRDFTVVAPAEPDAYTFVVERKYPHDVKSFTQGFLIHNGFLYEGTGQYGESRLRKIELSTGKVLLEREMDNTVFGEGITIFGNTLYQLSYKTGTGYRYDLETFEPKGEFQFHFGTGEGWGLTHNDTNLIASDGSATLYLLDPETLVETGRLRVFDHRGEVPMLNELEYHGGLLYANVYLTSQLVAIDPRTGMVKARYNARGIVDPAEANQKMDVLNGIAFNPLTGNMLLTGKYWSRVYEVRAIAAPGT